MSCKSSICRASSRRFALFVLKCSDWIDAIVVDRMRFIIAAAGCFWYGYSLTGRPKCSVFSLIITSTRWFEYVKLFASPRARPCVKRPQVYLLYMIQREYPMNNGFSTGEEDSRGNSDQICCLVDDNERCRRPAGNAAYSKRIQKTVAQRRLKLNIDPQVCIMCQTSFNSIGTPFTQIYS